VQTSQEFASSVQVRQLAYQCYALADIQCILSRIIVALCCPLLVSWQFEVAWKWARAVCIMPQPSWATPSATATNLIAGELCEMHRLYAREHRKLHSLKRAGCVLVVLHCIMFNHEGRAGKMNKLCSYQTIFTRYMFTFQFWSKLHGSI
jgi:hypothetical protein